MPRDIGDVSTIGEVTSDYLVRIVDNPNSEYPTEKLIPGAELTPAAGGVSVADTGGNYVGTNVETVLAELPGKFRPVLYIPAGTTDITPLLTAAAAAGSTHIIIPYSATAYPMLTKWTATGVHLEFEQGARFSANMVTPAMDLTGCRLTNVSLTSSYSAVLDAGSTATHGFESRSVILRTGCTVENYYQEYASAGLSFKGNSTTVRNASFANIRHYQGWGTALHASGSENYDIHIDGIKIVDCDRGCEIEYGAYDFVVENGYQSNVYPNGYTGQPGNYEVYSFVLDTHSHTGEGSVRNVVYRNWVLDNCGGGISAIRSDGANDSDLPSFNRWENITINGQATGTGYDSVYLQGHGHYADVRFGLGAGVNSKMKCYIANGVGTELVVRQATAYALPLVTGMATADNARVTVRKLSAPTTGTGYLLDIDSPNTTLDLDVRAVTGTTGYLRLDDSSHGSRVNSFVYTVDAGETFASVVALAGVNDAAIDGIYGVNNVVAVKDILTSGGVTRGFARGIISRSAAAVSVELGGASSLFDTTKLDVTLGTITDIGINSRIARDGVGTDVICSLGDHHAYAAGVAATSTAVPIVWPAANEGIWVRRRIGRRSSLTRFRFKVVTQSGNYYAAVTNSAGVVLWKTRTSVPAAGVVSLTISGVEVQPGEVITMVLALDNTTAAVCGVAATGADQNLFASVRGAPVTGKVANLYTTNTAVAGTITLGSTHPDFIPLVTLIEV